MRHRLGILLLILLFLCTFLAAADEAAWFITNADEETLRSMAGVRGLDASLPLADLREALLAGREAFTTEEAASTGEGPWSLEVVKADDMEVLPSGLVSLSGDVEVSFTTAEGESPLSLMASNMLLDPVAGRLSAYGGVRYRDSASDAGLQEVDADIVTYLYDSGDLLVSGGTTTSERTNNEDESVTFHTTGTLLNYRAADGGMFFQDGYLTSNPDTAYSSITADSIALLSGGDMFLTGAFLSIGRVPVLYMPAFFFPGSRLAFNPAFGFNSSRGAFFSTTWEVFGTYPGFAEAEMSSFASLLRTSSDESMVSNGLYYEPGEPEGGLARWAVDSGSYLALLFDVYSSTGFLVGFDTLLKPFDGALTLSSESSIILGPENRYTLGNWRWYSLNEASLSNSYASLSFSLPIYSDPYVLREYSNRLTSFSIDSIFGASQDFPSTRTSTVSSYDAYLSGSIRLPSQLRTDWVSSLSLSSIRAGASFDWVAARNGEPGHYEISDITLPSFNFSMSGQLFRFSSDGTLSTEEAVDDGWDITQQFVLSDPLLYDLYVIEPERAAARSADEYFVSLGYSVSERFSHEFELDMETWQASEGQVSSNASVRFNLEAGLGRWLKMTETLTPGYLYEWDEADDGSQSHDFTLLSTSNVSLPFIGLEYELSTYLYKFSSDWDGNSWSEEEVLASFDRDNVRSHSLTFSQGIGSVDNYGRLTASLRYTLPPLSSSLEPRLGYRLGGFSAAFSWRFEEKEDGSFDYRSDDVALSLGYTGTHFTLSFSALYESADLETATSIWAPLDLTASASVRTADRRWALSGYVDWQASSGGEVDVFDDVRAVLTMPWLSFTWNMTTDDGRLRNEYFLVESDIEDIGLSFWYGRIRLNAILDARLRYDFLNPYSSSFSLTTGIGFSIAEFLDLNISLTTTNNGFYRYMEDGTFSFRLMWDDLMRSFDFIGDGRRNTQFNMESLDLELIHYMDDWDLHLRYTATLESRGRDYTWVPTFAIFLRWNTMPDLKVDETWEQGVNGNWTPGSSLYAD